MIRYTPTLSFELDTSIEHGVRLTQLIDSVNRAESLAAGAAGEAGRADEDLVDEGHGVDEGHVVDEGDPSPGQR